ncbi:MAG: hypothetical protein H5T34_06450 [Candidatus Methanomethyliales bacterium]|nr:hypothetical protein [Candidatus Methanomethylicales archaeon]
MAISIPKSLKIISVLIAISAIVFVASLVAVAYTLMQSVPTVSVGSPSQNITDGVLEVSIPVTISNKGVLTLSDIFVTLTMKTSDGTPLLEVSSNRLTLPPGGSGTLQVRATMNASMVDPELMMLIMTEDQEFPITASLKGSVQPFLNVIVSANDTLKWGAPYKNLQIQEPTFEVYDVTHILIHVPISFKNNSTMFPVSGTGSILVVDEEEGREVGYGQAYIDARPGTEYRGTIDLYLEAPWFGRPELLTQGLVKNYTITVRLPAPLFGEVEQTQTVPMEWGAPIENPQLGEFSVAPYNSTHLMISIPLTFKDASVLPLRGTLSCIFYDVRGEEVGRSEYLGVEVQPGDTYFGTIIGYITNAAASQQVLNMLIRLETPYGTLEKGVPIYAQTP